MKVLILCGGRGTRLGEITRTIPKPLLKINNTPFLEIIIKNLKEGGYNDILLVCGYLGEEFSYLGKKYGLEIVVENEPLGTGGAILQMLERLPDKFIVMNGDTYSECHSHFSKNFGQNTIYVRYKRAHDRYDWIKFKNNKIVDAIASRKDFSEGYINSGAYIFEKRCFESFKKVHNSNYMSLETDFLPYWISNNKVLTEIVNGRFIDIGIPNDLNRASNVITQSRKAIFLDRDGVLIKDTKYPFNYNTFQYNHSLLKMLALDYERRNVEYYIMTNQSGIARDLYSEQAFIEDMNMFCDFLECEYGVPITKYYYCPHHPDFGNELYRKRCDCRKPMPGMLKRAIQEFNLDRSHVTFFGDKSSDAKAAHNAGIKFELIEFSESTLNA